MAMGEKASPKRHNQPATKFGFEGKRIGNAATTIKRI